MNVVIPGPAAPESRDPDEVTLTITHRDPPATTREDEPRSRKNVHDHLVKPGDSGSERTIFFEFLYSTFGIGRTHHQSVIVGLVRLPIKTPERPG